MWGGSGASERCCSDRLPSMDGFEWTGAIIKAPTHANPSNLQL